MKDPTLTRRRLTDADRTHCMKLFDCGLSLQEIADIMKISTSAVSYIKQAYKACINKDFDTLLTISRYHNSTVLWAMQLTGVAFPAEVLVDEEEPTVDAEPEETADVPNNTAIEDVLSDIRNLLTEIRDILK